ncbi:MAG: hypothetical protein EOP06_10260 [Proteobacteria bacterium]|nr:MAG: hypothetical protein EOP06_10260 [Pseudomonadota bacterium]
MRVLIAVMIVITSTGCANRRKVFEKQSGPRWVTVSEPEEFMTEAELNFMSLSKKTPLKKP